ncbi:hypothetical protein TrRE_jg1663 [Triparma retinervis]|uniref:U3 small nucleolar RNA-associated protein 25 n=1 Tax=Triparma retinervis TaxID=2557542 RepID=A0A9W7DSX2_9STRA|nr:hypothetical protein TrRE_jg1663 [Triparma retinervis]
MPPFKKKKDKKKKKKSGTVDKYYGEVVDEEQIKKSKKRLRAPVGASRLQPYVKKPRAPRPPSPPPSPTSAEELASESDSDGSVELDAAPSLELLTKTSKKSIYSDDEEEEESEDEGSESNSDSDSQSDSDPTPASRPTLPANQPNPFFHTFPSSPPSLSKSSSQTSNTQTSIFSPSPPPVDLSSAVSSFADALVTGGKRQNEDAVVGHILSHVNNVITVVSKNDKKVQDPPRDQGYFRNTVLVLLPTRGVALDYINVLLEKADTGSTDKASYVLNYERLEKEFSLDADDVEEEDVKKARKKGKQFMKFLGPFVNSDDDFKLGISLSPNFSDSITKIRKTGTSKTTKNHPIRLYSAFENSDIIVASPLGLKLLFSKDPTKVSPILSSLNIIHIPYADVLFNQNWAHVDEILSLCNKRPDSAEALKDISFDRVYEWVLDREDDDTSRTARQLVISSSFINADISSTFSKNALSLAGSYKTKLTSLGGAVGDVDVKVQQLFQRISCDDFRLASKMKLEYFRHNILKTIKSRKSTNNLVYIPSYFDFVSVRNLLLRLEISHVTITEYSRWSEVQRGRSRFFHGQKPILLYTGRAHFYHRLKIRGVRHLTFFGLPDYPWAYSDMVNCVERGDGSGGGEASCVSLFTKFEQFQLERIVGKENSKVVRKSDKETFMFF